MTRQTLTAPLVKKVTLNKAGRPIGSSYYLRLSRADVYIKLCESTPDAATLEALVSGASSDPLLGATVTAEVSFHEGLLDLCPGDPPHVQSRTGEYVALHTIKATSAR